ncbi:MAG: uroporphyrinogen decarboxylase [Alphaproteobacteria bacterium]|nr:uroporphyrinogen decarboxylase [Alphaproteobacteria bacterium]
MASETTRKRLLRVLAGLPVDRPPFWFMRQAGRYLGEYRRVRGEAGSFLELCYAPELAEEVTLQPIRRFHPDAAILFADILLVPEAMGQELAFREGEGPVLTPIRDVSALQALEPEGLHERLAPIYETVARLARSLPDDVALIGFAGAPWTVATYMVEGGGSPDQRLAKRWAFEDPAGFGRLIDLLVEATVAYLAAQVRAGAEVLQLFDTWSGSLPETAFARWCIEPTRRVVDGLRAAGIGVPIIGFPRGAGVGYRAFAERSGVDGVSFDSSLPLDWVQAELQPHVAVQGNLDPQVLVVGGEAMRREASRIMEQLAAGRFIFNLGHGIVPETPPEHVEALAEIVRGWRG